MAWYAFWQQEGEERWELMLAEQRERIVKDRAPAFTTILDVDNDFKSQMSAEEIQKVHYRGPFYADFDSDDLEEVIPQFKRFLKKLVDEHDFDLEQAHLYATGGKGFHCVIPWQCFIAKPPPKGVANLPHIYKEMALELYVDTLDLRVYSARRGRQFRTANVERKNKRFKVPITVKEALEMDIDLYNKLVSEPRHIAAPAPAELNPSLTLLYSTSHDKVDKAVKNKKKSKADEALLKRFGGDIPPSILSIMNGDNIVDGVGFQKLAIQLSLAARALGKTEEQFLTLCSGLCEKHKSDGVRYNTPQKRRAELSRMFQYMQDNPCYEFSVGGIKSLLHQEYKPTDLDNGNVAVEEEEADEEVDFALTMGLKITTNGIYKRTEEGLQKISALGLASPCQVNDLKTGECLGYDVSVHVHGKYKGRHWLPMGMFTSRAKFLGFTLTTGGVSMNATDAQVGAIADIMLSRAQRNNNVVYNVNREGIDLLFLPDGQMDIIWADHNQVVSNNGHSYRLTGSMSDGAEYRTDLYNAPPLERSELTEEFFHRLFSINRPDVVGKMFGWYLSCFLNQILRHLFGKFPLMQVFGPAGSGKTETSKLFAQLHYFMKTPKVVSVMNQTAFAMDTYVSCSGSIPLVLDEFKPREMRKDRLDKAKSVVRDNYNGSEAGRGRVSDASGASHLSLNSVENRAPITIIGEAMESQTAILERTIMVNMNKDGKRGHYDDFNFCRTHRHILGSLGRVAIDTAMGVNINGLRKLIETYIDEVARTIGERAYDNDRPVYNAAVVLTGLEFGRRILERIFGKEFEDEFARMHDGILGRGEILVPRIMSETSKVIDTMAHMSKIEDEDRNKLRIGIDYVVDGGILYLRVKNCYAKYLRYRRGTGEEALFDSTEAFVAAMNNYSAVIDTQGVNCQALKDSPSTLVYGLSIDHLTKENVGEFK